MYICIYNIYIYIICLGVFDPLTEWDAPLVKSHGMIFRWVPGNPLPVKVNRQFGDGLYHPSMAILGMVYDWVKLC